MHLLFFNPQGNFDEHDSHLTAHADFGGQLVYVKELAMAMVDAGHEVDIVTRRIVDPDWPEFAAPIGHYPGYGTALRIVRIPCGGDAFLPKEQLWPHLPEFVGNTLRFYDRGLPDFVTAHYGDGGYCAALLQQSAPLGFTFTGHSLGAQKLDKLKSAGATADELEERYCFSRRIAAERLAMELASRIITSTRQERREQYAHPLYRGAVDVEDDTRFAVIPPGVNTQLFSLEAADEDAAIGDRLRGVLDRPEEPHIVISSRIDEKKNIGAAVEAWAGDPDLHRRAGLALCVRGLDDPWRSIGSLTDEEQEILQPILDRITASGLRGRVVFLNLQSQAELAATYRYFARRGSLFVLPSVYEPFGLAPIEAAACGLACVATRNGGPSEIFEGGAGILVDPFDPADIARGMREALDRHDELSARGRQRVLERYTWQRTAGRYLEVIGQERGRVESSRTATPAPDASDRISAYLEGGAGPGTA
jgi:sucrose-phosphate synthase